MQDDAPQRHFAGVLHTVAIQVFPDAVADFQRRRPAYGFQVAQAIRSKTDRFLSTFRGKVTIISEFGAEANTHNPPGRPGSFSFQTRFLRQHINAYRGKAGLSGMLIWNLRDFAVAPSFAGGSISRQVPGIKIVRGVNQKGLFDHNGRPKPSVDVVRELFGPLGTGLRGAS